MEIIAQKEEGQGILHSIQSGVQESLQWQSSGDHLQRNKTRE